MFFCLTVAIISTLLWVNLLFAECINSVNKHYASAEDNKTELANAKLRILLVIIMGLFWSAVIYYW